MRGAESMPEQAALQTEARLDEGEQVLRSCLEQIVVEHYSNRPSRIEAIERKRSQFSSFYASDIITVRLASGDELKVFLKDFGSFHHVKDTMKERREREAVVYRALRPDS